MPRGYCKECDRLVEIRPGELKPHSNRAVNWYPFSHPKLGDDTGGEECPGVKIAL